MTRRHRPDLPEAAALRQRALERFEAQRAKLLRDTEGDLRRLVHEGQVHQFELEIQNEELTRSRAEIEAALQRYTELFDFAPIGYCVIGSDLAIRQINLAGARLLGFERERLIGCQFIFFVAARQRCACAEMIRDVLTRDQDRRSQTLELTLEPDQQPLVEARVTAALLQGPEPTVLLALEDITARKCAEASVREEIRRKDEFLAILSHELRNPLAPIKSSLFVLDRAAGEQARKAHAVIERQVTHLTRIVDDLLDITRIARGKALLQRERLELGELVRRTIDDHRQSFEGAGIELEARFGSELLWVEADPTRLVQILGNLLANAAKFTPRQGRVAVHLRRETEQAVLSVSDTGVGIEASMRERLFQPFSQAPQHLDRTRGGLGLGLAMVKGLVELHGGTVDWTSGGLGCGAEFTVRLPLAPAPDQAARPREPLRDRRHRVLVIEDNFDAADSLRQALELIGHEAQVAYDGAAGLAMARAAHPEIVICDLGLPGMNGYEVARAFRADDGLKDSFLIALSGYAMPEDVQRATEAGFDRHVAKPPDLGQLEQLFGNAAAQVGAE